MPSPSFVRPALIALLAACQGVEPSDSTADPFVLRGLSPQEARALTPIGDPIEAALVAPPLVPPPVGRDHASTVTVHLEVTEVVRRLADGVDYTFWTFGGDVPGRFIRVRQGDTVEFHLQNSPDSRMPHNIDLHAVTGPGGGAASSATAPGHESVFSFQALNAGLYVYHCATAPVPMHIANGMYGLILVEPPGGLPPVDREYYVMQGDIYTAGGTNEPGLQAFDQQKSTNEEPTYVVFNGAVGALTGDGALTANVGERVRLYYGVGGPNLTSSFHVIGEVFDRVYTEGGLRYQEQVQTTMVPSGGSAMVEFDVEAPGTYILVDHSLSRAFDKGAIGMLVVSGEPQPGIYSGKTADLPYTPAGVAASVAPTTDDPMENGRRTFETVCAACHQPDGNGLAGTFPPLAGTPRVNGPADDLIAVPLRGLSGPITVAGRAYSGQMPAFDNLSDQEIADVLTYIRASFGNHAGPIAASDVTRLRAAP
jgi:nitrite reductase (NO-forming)